MSPKELKKLAKACREAGIRTFKNSEVEFTLSDDMVLRNVTKRLKKTELTQNSNVMDDAFKSDTLTDEQMLFYSVAELPEGIS
jgi:hypothetical protein